MSIPVHVKSPGVQLPVLKPGQVRYVVAREGTFLERRTAMYATSVRTSQPVVSLETHAERCTLYIPGIPRVMSRAMLAFFVEAYRLHQGEAALVLLYDPRRRRFRWHCPVQTVEVYRSFGRLRSYDSITYEMPLELPDGYVIFGDAHSHGDMLPLPSHVDHGDETHKDGLHVIVGGLGRNREPQYHIDFVMDGLRFAVAPDIVFDDATCHPFCRAPRSWTKRIRMVRPSNSSTSSSNVTQRNGSTYNSRNDRRNWH